MRDEGAGRVRSMPSSDLGARPLAARRGLRRLDAQRSARVSPLLARLARANGSRPTRIGRYFNLPRYFLNLVAL